MRRRDSTSTISGAEMVRRGRGLKGGLEVGGTFCFADDWSFFLEFATDILETGATTCNCFSISPLSVVISLIAVSG